MRSPDQRFLSASETGEILLTDWVCHWELFSLEQRGRVVQLQLVVGALVVEAHARLVGEHAQPVGEVEVARAALLLAQNLGRAVLAALEGLDRAQEPRLRVWGVLLLGGSSLGRAGAQERRAALHGVRPRRHPQGAEVRKAEVADTAAEGRVLFGI